MNEVQNEVQSHDGAWFADIHREKYLQILSVRQSFRENGRELGEFEILVGRDIFSRINYSWEAQNAYERPYEFHR